MYNIFNEYTIEHLNNVKRLKEIMRKIEIISTKLGTWEGNMMMCYVACHTAWEANIVKPGDPKDRISLMNELSQLKAEANKLFDLI